jgi:DNA-binding transcriptional LysR family regulator
MLPMMQQCYESAVQAKSLAQSIKSGAVAPLTVALSLGLHIGVLISFLTELVRVFRGLELAFKRGNNAEVAEILKKGEAEVAVAGPLGETWDRLDAWPLFTEPYRLAVSKDHPFASRLSVKPEELKKERLLNRTYCEHSDRLAAFFKDHGVPMDVMHKVVSESDLAALVKANVGVAIVPECSGRAEGVKLLGIEGLDLSRTVSVYAVAGRQRSAAAATLIKMLRAADWADLEKASASQATSAA